MTTIFSREIIRKFVEPYENSTILRCSLNLSPLTGQIYNGNHFFHIDNVNQRIDNPHQSSRVSCETVTAAKINKWKLEQSLSYLPPEQSAIGNCWCPLWHMQFLQKMRRNCMTWRALGINIRANRHVQFSRPGWAILYC